MRRAFYAVAAPAAMLVASGCLATKNDMRILQEELRATRAATAAADAARRSQMDSIARVSASTSTANISRVESLVRSSNDSLRMFTQRFDAFRLATIEQLRLLNVELDRLAAITAQFPNVSRELRAQLEELSAARVLAPPPVPGGVPPDDPGQPPRSPPTSQQPPPVSPPGMQIPGPTQLLQQGSQSLSMGSCRGARQTLQLIITNYPTYDDVPLALKYIAETFSPCEGNKAAADSVYAIVVSQYPRSEHAGIALYRRGLYEEDQRRYPEARAIFERVVREYPMSDVARLACSKLNRPNC